MSMRATTVGMIGTALLAAALAGVAGGQSLFQRQPGVTPEQANVDPAEPLYAVSLIAIPPPPPRSYVVNDLITIVVSEQTTVRREQTVETEKEYDLTAARVSWPDLVRFLALADDVDDVGTAAELEIGHESEFESEGTYERDDQVIGRITARVIDVKPNDTLVLEARSVIQTDEEKQTLLLSGVCRLEDVAQDNTVLSHQLFDLRYEIHHEGQMAEATRKGLVPRVLETLFSF